MTNQSKKSSDPHPRREGQHYSAEDVRGGEIILRKRWQRVIFIAGLVGFVFLAVIVSIDS